MNVVAMTNTLYNVYMKTKIISKAELEKLYQSKTQQEIADIYGVARTTVQNWVKKYGLSGLSKRGGHNIIDFCTQRELKELYVQKRLSSIEIGKMFGVGKHVVLTRLKKNGIQRRSISESRKGKLDGENSPSYKGALYKTTSGYLAKKLLLDERGHHRCDGFNRAYVHTYTMEKYIGRKLKPDEVVHHVDCVRTNNDISNLILFPNQDAHIKFHKYIESLGMYDLGILKEKPKYQIPKGIVIPKEVNIKI